MSDSAKKTKTYCFNHTNNILSISGNLNSI
jgi:hypothetical protein